MDYCVTEYGFCVDFVTCVQCALKSHVSPQCGDGIEFKNSKVRVKQTKARKTGCVDIFQWTTSRLMENIKY